VAQRVTCGKREKGVETVDQGVRQKKMSRPGRSVPWGVEEDSQKKKKGFRPVIPSPKTSKDAHQKHIKNGEEESGGRKPTQGSKAPGGPRKTVTEYPKGQWANRFLSFPRAKAGWGWNKED